MTKKKVRDPNYLTKLARRMRGMGFRMWSARSTKADATKSANKLRTGKNKGVYFVRIVKISSKRGYPWPWAVYYKEKGGW